MAKYAGNVGYVIPKNTSPGVWTPQVTTKFMRGDVLNLVTRSSDYSKINEDISLTHRISIVADAFAFDNFMHIRFIEWKGVKWKVNSAEINRPRIILNIGGVYNVR